ncbi:MAG TPA: tetratricopeptide repeat protein, partial [Blastocatellia bacterium]
MSTASREQVAHEPRSTGFFLSRRTIIAISGIALVLIALVAWWLLRSPLSKRGMDALVSTFSARRIIESRLAGGFAAAKFDPSRDNRDGINEDEFARARRLIEDSVVYEEGFDASLVQARLLVIDGRYTEAERVLRKTNQTNERSAALHNDLGVCLMEAGKIEDALEEFDRAIEVDGKMSEARFNHALCYERLELRDAAREEYSRIVEMERDPGWQSDMRERIDKLSVLPAPDNSDGNSIARFNTALTEGRNDEAKEIAAGNFDTFCRYALIDLTTEHLSAAVAGEKDKSEAALRKMERIGETFIETKGDRFVADAAIYLRNLSQEDQPEELKLIGEYSDAIKAMNARSEAERQAGFDRLSKVAESFRARGNDQRAIRTELRIAYYLYQSGKMESAIALFEKNRPIAEQHQWLGENADIVNGLGIAYTRLGRDVSSIRF